MQRESQKKLLLVNVYSKMCIVEIESSGCSSCPAETIKGINNST